jgi:biopolymer transport protein ExbB/TolQ
VHHAVLIGLIVFGVAVAFGLALVAVRALAAWRKFRRFRRTVLGRLGEISAELTKLEKRGTKAAESAARLDAARARLEASLKSASVLAGAAGETWSLIGRARGIVPTK